MARFYIHPGEFIRDEPFAVLAPAFYHPHEDSSTLVTAPKRREKINPFKFVTTGGLNPEPFRIGFDPSEMQNCLYTVDVMLDMFQKKIEFDIIQDHDIPTIFDGIDRYLLYIRADVELRLEAAVNYVKVMLDFRAELYKMYFRYMKKNPHALAELYPNHDAENNIFTLLASINGMNYEAHKSDPLKIRAKPPYTIESTEPVSKDSAKSNEDAFDDSLGMHYANTTKDIEAKFNIDEFLQKG